MRSAGNRKPIAPARRAETQRHFDEKPAARSLAAGFVLAGPRPSIRIARLRPLLSASDSVVSVNYEASSPAKGSSDAEVTVAQDSSLVESRGARIRT